MRSNSTYTKVFTLFLFTLLSINLNAFQVPIEVVANDQLSATPQALPMVCSTAPVISCPSIYNACPGDPYSPDVAGMATAVAGDPDCPTPVVSYEDIVISTGPCEGEMEIQRMWTAVYPNNEFPLLYADCTQLIFLKDNENPEIVECPENIIMAPNEDCEAVVTWEEPTATDDCTLMSFTSNFESGATFPLGETTVTYTAIDECGKTTTCSFIVNVAGSCCFDAPSISCPPIFNACPGTSTDPSTTGTATADSGSDFCATPIITYEDDIITEGPCEGAIKINRTWTATDPDNPDLANSCNQIINIADTQAPVITNCPTNMTVSPNNDCQAVVIWDLPEATDNCGIESFTSDYQSGDTFEEGTTTVTYIALDNCGQQTSCSFTVTVSACCTTPPTLTCPPDFLGCPGTDINPVVGDNCTGIPDAYTGWAVATCNGEEGSDDPVGVIYDIRNTPSAPQSEDWAPSITDLHPANWTLMQIGQVFGIALGNNNDVYLGASDIYDTQYDTDPYGPGQIFKAEANNDFLASPFVELPNTGGALNGVGNLVFDKANNQLFASNLEDGKIYRISSDGTIIDSYDPWSADNGNAGIVSPAEQVWAIGLNNEDGNQKLYFPRIDGSTRDMYSITLSDGAFPSEGSESLEFSNIMGVGLRISDIAFSNDGNSMVFSERGTKFTTGAHDSKTIKYTKANGNWTMDLKYFVGGWVTEDYPSIDVVPGENSAGGVDFGATNVDDSIEGCDQLVWASMNYFKTDNGNLYYGIQGIQASGNNSSESDTDPNTDTDIIIDFDGEYETFVQKGDLGDVEIFRPGGNIASSPTGVATATNAGNGCGEPIITFSDEIISEGPCEGAIKISRTWTATDSENSNLVSTCEQIIELGDTEAPVVTDCPADITVETTSATAAVSWDSPSGNDDCNLEWFMSDYQSGDDFNPGTTLVTYTAADGCGNTTLCTFNVTVIQICDTPPTISCPAIYNACPGTSTEPSTTGSATAAPGNDICDEPIITYSDDIISEGPCEGAIKISRTWTATAAENEDLTSTCIQIITLTDTEPPVITDCPVDITVETTGNATNVTWNEPSATDNCNLEWIMSDIDNGSSFGVGTTLVTYSAVDGCGNATLCTFNVTVEQTCNSNPIITCPSNIIACPSSSIHPNDTGIATAVAGEAGCEAPVISYNDVIITSGPCTGAKKFKRTWTATDPNNSSLTASCFQIIELVDNEVPVIYECPEDITVSTSDATAIVNWEEPTATDNCELEWIMGDYMPGDAFPIGTTLVTYTAADGCGNATLCTFNVTVESEGSIECPDDITVPCNGPNGSTVTWPLPTIESNCAPCTSGAPIQGFVYMGQLNGSSYYCSTTPANSDIASGIAASYNGYLASITTQEENDLLLGFLGTQCAYIGYSDMAEEGNFVWASGETSTFTDWAPGQPNDFNGNQDCVVLNCGEGWNDENCDIEHEYIMEIPCTSYNQTTGPANGSVIPVGTHVITYVVTDQCDNEFECSFEVTVEEGMTLECPNDYTFTCPSGTNGVNAYWNTPTINTCCDDCTGTSGAPISGFMYMGSYGGSDYYCSLNTATWPQANVSAVANGGHLAEINDSGENAFLANILTLQKAWIGLNDADQEGTFTWSNGNPLSYTNWYPGQPNDQDGAQDYVAMLSTGLWNDETNSLKYEYIMEVPCSNSVTQIGGPTSGSYIPVGTTTITYAGIDGCGNTDTCSFDITVLESDCSPSGLDSWYMWIEHLGLGTFNNTSGNDGGYADYTDMCIDVNQGQTYPLTFTPGFDSNIYVVYWKMWIDYNQDGDYLDNGEFVAYGSGSTTLTGNLPIPTTCALGATTMRVSMKFGSYPSGPCETFSHGEVEDYCVNITGNGSKAADENTSSIIETEPIVLSPNVSALGQSIGISNSSSNDVRSENVDTEDKIEAIIYPTPANEVLYIQLSRNVDTQLYLLDNLGRMVKTINANKQLIELDVKDFQNGVYFLKSKDGLLNEKVVIQR